MSNGNGVDSHPAAPSAKLATIKDKGKAPCRSHENPTLMPPACLPGVRKLPNLAPKPAVINSESIYYFGGDSQRKRPRVGDEIHKARHSYHNKYILRWNQYPSRMMPGLTWVLIS